MMLPQGLLPLLIFALWAGAAFAQEVPKFSAAEYERCLAAPDSCFEVPTGVCDACKIRNRRVGVGEAYRLLEESTEAFYLNRLQNPAFGRAYDDAKIRLLDCFNALKRLTNPEGKEEIIFDQEVALPTGLMRKVGEEKAGDETVPVYFMRPNTLQARLMSMNPAVPDREEMLARTELLARLGTRILATYKKRIDRDIPNLVEAAGGDPLTVERCDEVSRPIPVGSGGLKFVGRERDHRPKSIEVNRDACSQVATAFNREFGLVDDEGKIDPSYHGWLVPLSCPRKESEPVGDEEVGAVDIETIADNTLAAEGDVKELLDNNTLGCPGGDPDKVVLSHEKALAASLGTGKLDEIIAAIEAGKIGTEKIAREIAYKRIPELHLDTLLNYMREKVPAHYQAVVNALSGWKLAAELAIAGKGPYAPAVIERAIPLAARSLHLRTRYYEEMVRVYMARLSESGAEGKDLVQAQEALMVALRVLDETKDPDVSAGTLWSRYERFLAVEEAVRKVEYLKNAAHARRIRRLEHFATVLTFVKDRLKDAASAIAAVASAPCGGCAATWVSTGLNALDTATSQQILEGKVKWDQVAKEAVVDVGTGGLARVGGKYVKQALAGRSYAHLGQAAGSSLRQRVSEEAAEEAIDVVQSAAQACLNDQTGRGCLDSAGQAVTDNYTTADGWFSRGTGAAVRRSLYGTKTGRKVVAATEKRRESNQALRERHRALLEQGDAAERERAEATRELEGSPEGSPRYQAARKRAIDALARRQRAAYEGDRARKALQDAMGAEIRAIEAETGKVAREAEGKASELAALATKLRKDAETLPGTERDQALAEAARLEAFAAAEKARAKTLSQDGAARTEVAAREMKELERAPDPEVQRMADADSVIKEIEHAQDEQARLERELVRTPKDSRKKQNLQRELDEARSREFAALDKAEAAEGARRQTTREPAAGRRSAPLQVPVAPPDRALDRPSRSMQRSAWSFERRIEANLDDPSLNDVQRDKRAKARKKAADRVLNDAEKYFNEIGVKYERKTYRDQATGDARAYLSILPGGPRDHYLSRILNLRKETTADGTRRDGMARSKLDELSLQFDPYILMDGTTGGSYAPQTHRINVSVSSLWVKKGVDSTVQHEIRHAKSELDRGTGGGDPAFHADLYIRSPPGVAANEGIAPKAGYDGYGSSDELNAYGHENYGANLQRLRSELRAKSGLKGGQDSKTGVFGREPETLREAELGARQVRDLAEGLEKRVSEAIREIGSGKATVNEGTYDAAGTVPVDIVYVDVKTAAGNWLEIQLPRLKDATTAGGDAKEAALRALQLIKAKALRQQAESEGALRLTSQLAADPRYRADGPAATTLIDEQLRVQRLYTRQEQKFRADFQAAKSQSERDALMTDFENAMVDARVLEKAVSRDMASIDKKKVSDSEKAREKAELLKDYREELEADFGPETPPGRTPASSSP